MIRSGVNEDNEVVNSETKNTDVDIGFAKPFGGTVVPPGYLYCDGSEVSRQAYDKLFAAIGTTWGEGDGENTFNIPDLRGIFIRCDGGENNAPMGERQEDAIRNIDGSFSIRDAGVSGAAITGDYGQGTISVTPISNPGTNHIVAAGDAFGLHNITFAPSRIIQAAPEVRPVNVAMKYCIRYE